MSITNTYLETNISSNILVNLVNNKTELVKKYLLENKSFDINSNTFDNINKYTLLHMAIISKNYELIDFLLKMHGVNIDILNSYNKSCLDSALESGDLKIVKLFINFINTEKDKTILRFNSDRKYYQSELKRLNDRINVLKDSNQIISSDNSRLSKEIALEKNKNYRNNNMLVLERKRKRSLETEVTELNKKNKKLRLSIETLSESLGK